MVAIVSLLCGIAAAPSARADFQYTRTDGARGTLARVRRGNENLVSLRQLCFALGCRVMYQWPRSRAVVQSPNGRLAAIVSALTSVALIDGRVFDANGSVLPDSKEGYLLPSGLAQKIVSGLLLGKLQETRGDDEKTRRQPVDNPADVLHTIVLDPGHGGNDWGTGEGGIYEKDVAVLYAFRIRDEIKRVMPDVEVILTREDDRFVSLPDRARIANSRGASLFLSLHLNHAPNPGAEGSEAYILSPEATDDEARKLALAENDTWLKTARIAESGGVVKKILVDMEQVKYIQDSAFAGALIQQELASLERLKGLKSRGVKQAMFYVLSQVAMPSVLLEIAFLSNTGDRSRLMDVVFRDEFARCVVAALKRYRDKVSTKEVSG